MKFVEFIDADAHNTFDVVFVNPKKIRYIRPLDANRTILVFDKKHILTVDGTYDEIVDLLKKYG